MGDPGVIFGWEGQGACAVAVSCQRGLLNPLPPKTKAQISQRIPDCSTLPLIFRHFGETTSNVLIGAQTCPTFFMGPDPKRVHVDWIPGSSCDVLGCPEFSLTVLSKRVKRRVSPPLS